MNDKVYKIRNSKGLWSNGGSTPRFSTKGKVWMTKGALSGHIAQFYNRNDRYAIDAQKWEIVEYQYYESGKSAVSDYLDRKKKMDALIIKYGEATASIYNVLDKEDKVGEYRWLLVIEIAKYSNISTSREDCQENVKELMKEASKNNIKRTDFRTTTAIDHDKNGSYFRAVFAFKDRNKAMMFRLLSQYPTNFLDLVEASEIE